MRTLCQSLHCTYLSTATPKILNKPISCLQASLHVYSEMSACCSAYDLENKVIGTVGAGRIGQRVLSRLQVVAALEETTCFPACCSLHDVKQQTMI